MKKRILGLGLLIVSFAGSASFAAPTYHYFYGIGCSHCLKVDQYFESNGTLEKFPITKHEIRNDPQGLQLLKTYLAELNLTLSQIWTPFMVIEEEGQDLSYQLGAPNIISFFEALEKGEKADSSNQLGVETTAIDLEEAAVKNPLRFLGIMIPLAVGDSINPCAFAVMLLLLSTILSKSKSRKRTLAAGLLFSLAIFVSYFLIGLGVYKLLDSVAISTGFKRVVGAIGILVGLANIKDYFWYGEGFLMEVPLSRRPTMMKLIQSTLSPRGAFVIGILVSLFLLPCSSGPYIAILGLLKAESQSINTLGMWYLALYNLIFILPMLLITLMVSGGWKSVEQIAKFKNKNTKLMHLIIGLLMIGLGVYVIGSIYFNRM